MNKKPIGVFISGRGSNLESIINACKDENFPAKVVCVFSDNANAEGLQFALKNNIDTHTLDLNNFESKDHFEEEILKLIKPYNIELICLFDSNRSLHNDSSIIYFTVYIMHTTS